MKRAKKWRKERKKYLPMITPIERKIIKGLLLPKFERHRSERDPIIGVRKKPMSGDKHQIKVMCSWRTPIIGR